MIKSFIIIAYLFIMLPLIIGASITLLIKCRRGFSFLYVSGYAIYLALFEIMMILQGSRDSSYSRLLKSWHLTIVLISIAAILLLLSSILIARKRNIIGSIFPISISKTNLITIFITIALVLFSIVLLVPHAQDQTPELCRLTIESNQLISIDPSTDAAYTDPSVYPGYLFLLYAIGSTVAGIDVTVFIHLLMPIVFIPFFVCCYDQIGSMLFPAPQQSKDRTNFVRFIILFYLLMIPFEAHLAFAPYRNIWNGVTLGSSCLLPLFISICIDFIRHFSIRSIKTNSVFSVSESIIMIIVLALSTMLCIRFSLVLNILIIIAAIGTVIISFITHKLFEKKRGAQL